MLNKLDKYQICACISKCEAPFFSEFAPNIKKNNFKFIFFFFAIGLYSLLGYFIN